MHNCIKCGCELSHDDIGLHKKLVNRAAEEFMCLRCLAEYFGVSESALHKKIEQFRAQGCMLFK